MKYTFTILLFICIICRGQNVSSSLYNMDNGLPQNSVKDIIKDKYGFIWISTENNLVRYDGRKFETFQNPDIPQSQIGDFYGDIKKDSIIVFGSSQEKRILLKNRRLKAVVNKSIKRTFINDRGDSFTLLNKNSSNEVYFSELNYYINLPYSQYFFIQGREVTYSLSGKKRTHPILYENVKNIFMFDDILFIRDTHSKKITALKQGQEIRTTAPSILFDPETKIHWQQTTGQLFVVNRNKIYLGSYSQNTLKFELLLTHEDIRNPHYSIYYDKDYNKIYLGSLTRGLNILTISSFKNVFDNYVAYASLPYSSDSFITPEGIVLEKNGILKEYHFKESEFDKNVMIYDDYKNIIYGKNTSIIKLYKNTNYKTSDKINFESKINKIYNLNKYYSISFTDKYDNHFLSFYDNSSFGNPCYTFQFKNEVTSLATADKNFIVGTTNELYNVSLKDNNIKKIAGNINVKLIIKNTDESYWIFTRGQGFFLMKSLQLIAIPSDDKRSLLSAHYILEDSKENLWITSNNGLFKTSKKEIYNFLKDSNKKPYYYRYDTKNGLLNNEFNGSAVYNTYQLDNQYFVFPSMAGFVVFNPKDIRSYYPKKESLLIERIKVDNKDIHFFNQIIKIKNTFNNIQILLDIPYYSSEENLQISVKQDDQPWKKTEGRTLDIYSIEPGTHKMTFRVYLGPEVGYEYKTINLEIIPFFYQTKIFKFLIIFIIALGIASIIYYNIKHLSGKNVKLEKQLVFESEYQKKVIETIFHDITTPLKFIFVLSQKLKETDNPEIQKRYFDSIHKSSEELYKFTSDLKKYAGLFKSSETNEVCNIYEIVEEKRNLFNEVAKQKNVTILNDISNFLFIETNKKVLSVILHNIIDNAIKNTENNLIKIKNTLCNDRIAINIEDRGTGMNQQQIEHYNMLSLAEGNELLNSKKIGLGLPLVIQLVKQLNASISFQNNIPTGTIIKIILKTKPDDTNINN